MDGPSKADQFDEDSDNEGEPPNDLYVLFFTFYKWKAFVKSFDTKDFLNEIEKDDKNFIELREMNLKEIRDEFFEIKRKIDTNLQFFFRS